MAPPTAPAKTVDGGADDANLPVADVVVADETVPIAESVAETVEPLAAARSTRCTPLRAGSARTRAPSCPSCARDFVIVAFAARA